jgi:putative transposase
MNLVLGNIYHVYNRGNNKEPIFFKSDNYSYFLSNINRYVIPHCDLLAYCLMPNHFHLLVMQMNVVLKK